MGSMFGPFTSILENMGNVTLPQREGREAQRRRQRETRSALCGSRFRNDLGARVCFCLLHSPVLFGHEGLDLCLRSRLLATELVARKTQHSEAVELLEEFLIAFVLGGRTSDRCKVDNERDLARKGAEVADVAVDVLGGEPRVQGVARRCHDAIGPRRERKVGSMCVCE